MACLSGDMAVAKGLVRCHPIDETDCSGMTALMFAVKSKSLDVVAFLGRKGADINVTDNRGQTCLHISSWYGTPATTKYLLDSGLDVNIRGAFGNTPIMTACKRGSKEMFDLLLVKGANLHLSNNKDSSCLHLACMSVGNNAHIANELLDRGLKIDAKDKYHKTPAMYAISKVNVNTLKLILSRNASRYAVVRSIRSSLLHYACDIKDISTDIPKLLLEVGLPVNEQNSDRQTSLMCAAGHGNQALVDFLIHSGANLRAVDNNRFNCVKHAERNGHFDLRDYLSRRLSTES